MPLAMAAASSNRKAGLVALASGPRSRCSRGMAGLTAFAAEDVLAIVPRVTIVSDPARPRYGPRNLAFADDLDGWVIGGSSRAEVTGAHWDDYTVAAADGTATLTAAVPQPYGDVFAHQLWIVGEYGSATVTLAAEISAQDVAGHAELSLFTITHTEERQS